MCEEKTCDCKEVEETPQEDYLENLVRRREVRVWQINSGQKAGKLTGMSSRR